MIHKRTRSALAVLTSAALLAACGGGEDEAGAGGSEPSLPDTSASAGDSTSETTDDATSETTSGGDGVEALREAGTVRVGTKFDQPFFGVQSPDGVQGFDAEIAKLIVEGIFEDGDPQSHIEFTEAVSANREPFLENDQVDMVIATYTINDDRDEIVDFAGPYYSAGQDIMVLADNPEGIEGIDDLNTTDFTTCTVEGSTSLENLQEMAPDADVITFDAYSACADAMSDGRVAAVTTDNVILLGLIEEAGDEFMLVDNPFTEEPYGIGVPEGSDLRCFVNDRLQAIYDSGEWAEAWESTAGQIAQTPEPPEIDDEGC